MNFFISHLHTDIRRTRLTRRGATDISGNVPHGLHKAYARMEKISLPEPSQGKSLLSDVLNERRSYDGGNSEKRLSLLEWGTLLGQALKKRQGSSSRNYPSGGGLYPVETYVVGGITDASIPAVFHYNPTLHALEKLWPLSSEFNLKDLARKPDDLLFSAMIIFTSVWERSSAKYGDLTYSHALLEAGHMSENVLLVATSLGLQTRPMAGFNDELIMRLLDLKSEKEQPIHSIVISK